MTSSSGLSPSLSPSGGHSPWLAAFAVAATYGIFAAAQALWPDAPVPGPEVPEAAVVVAHAPARLRCETCGLVEAIEPTAAVGDRPAGWVFSVRLPDGSLRHSSAALRGRWQIGDGMQLIGGDRTWSLP
jgi:hypothetical protein